MSSAYRTGEQNLIFVTSVSTPFITILNIVGEIEPPCGTPSVVSENTPLSMIPASNHVFTTLLLSGRFFIIYLCITLSYAFLMSMLSINRFCGVPLVFLCIYVMACFAFRPIRKPKLRGSALCS
jgi:hypothetical protein